ncbi:MAG TPA: methyltransferase domain-containing protein [Ktedonobacteraceae bacterium]|nr:methyltransferase domain-containing protein [Ktedonobacteraceae bacterium]
MATRDAYCFINDLDASTVEGLIARLEFRGKDPTFTRMRDAYLAQLALPPTAHILELGCGTGVVMRALAQRSDFSGHLVGVDQSPVLITAARRLAAEEGVDQRIEFQVSDAHHLAVADSSFDAVIAHTLLSHVADPLMVLKEAARVVRPGGSVAIFDGDFASLTFAHPDRAFARVMDEALIEAVVTHPRLMRDLPRLLQQAGLDIMATIAYVYSEVGTGTFFAGFAEAYAPLVQHAGLMAASQVEDWLLEQRRALEQHTFFAACNFYAYLTRRPTAQ